MTLHLLSFFFFFFFSTRKKTIPFLSLTALPPPPTTTTTTTSSLAPLFTEKNVYSSDKSRNCSIPWKDSSSYCTNFFEIVTRQQQLTISFCPSCHTKRTSFVSVLKAFLKPKLVNDLSNVILQLIIIKGLLYNAMQIKLSIP